MHRNLHNTLFLVFWGLALVGIIGSIYYNDLAAQAPRVENRKIDRLLIEEKIRNGSLSNHPARYYKKHSDMGEEP